MHEDEPVRKSVLLAKDAGNPLPLPYQIDGKYTESIGAGAEKVEDGNPRPSSELKAMRKALSVIGDPLPLDYMESTARRVGSNDNKSAMAAAAASVAVAEEELKGGEQPEEERVEELFGKPAQVKKRRAVRLADLGQPLPLKYNPAFHGNHRQRVETSRQQSPTLISSPRLANVYDFGSPLPLHYTDEEIETEEYLRWKSSSTSEPFEEWKQETETGARNQNRIPTEGHVIHRREGDTSHSEVEEIQEARENVTSSPDDSNDENSSRREMDKDQDQQQEQEKVNTLTDDVLPSTQDSLGSFDTEPGQAMDDEIQRYIVHEDYRGLEERIENPEFRLKLLRYTRRLKKQYDFLCKVIDSKNAISSSSTSPSPPTPPTKSVYLRSAAVSTAVFVLLCTISYFLAD